LVAETFEKRVQNETAKRFSVGNTKVNILALTAVSKIKILLTSYNFVNLVVLVLPGPSEGQGKEEFCGDPTVRPRSKV